MSLLLILTALITTLIVSIYFYVKNTFSYWKRKGVPFVEPVFPFGNLKNVFLQKSSLPGQLSELYKSTDEPFCGIYSSMEPILLVRDPQTVRDILVKDFPYFNERGWFVDEKVDPMYNNILMQNGEKWKDMRTKLTPAFSPNKVKDMFPTMIECGKTLEKYMRKYAENSETVEVREVFALLATNIIASIGFGIDVDCIENPDSEFRQYGKRFFEGTIKNALRKVLIFSAPKLAKLFRVRFVDKDVADFMKGVIQQNIDYREKNNVSRRDFFQLLLQVRNTGSVNDDNDWTTKATDGKKLFSLDDITAQAYLFLVGGYESSSSTMSFCLYELAKNQKCQNEAYEEINSVLMKYNGELNYESVNEMKYIDRCLDGEFSCVFSRKKKQNIALC